MIAFLINNRLSMEAIYFASGPLLVVIGIVGLFQLVIAKNDLAIRCRREAATLSASQICQYLSKIIPFNNLLDSKLKSYGYPEYAGEVGKFTRDAISRILSKDELGKISDVGIKAAQEFIDAFNAMEAFAVFFTKGVADEEIAFSSVGLTFCASIKKWYPFICMVRSEGNLNYYDNIVKLYQIWDSRKKRLVLGNQVENIRKQLSDLKFNKINPIGFK